MLIPQNSRKIITRNKYTQRVPITWLFTQRTYIQVGVQTELGEVVLQVNPEVHVLY
jgi:hypothetical protein